MNSQGFGKLTVAGKKKNVNIPAVMAEKGVCWRKSGVVGCVWEGIPHWILEWMDKECRFLLIVISRAAAFEQRNAERHFLARWDCR